MCQGIKDTERTEYQPLQPITPTLTPTDDWGETDMERIIHINGGIGPKELRFKWKIIAREAGEEITAVQARAIREVLPTMLSAM
jgi:hypothetical protein